MLDDYAAKNIEAVASKAKKRLAELLPHRELLLAQAEPWTEPTVDFWGITEEPSPPTATPVEFSVRKTQPFVVLRAEFTVPKDVIERHGDWPPADEPTLLAAAAAEISTVFVGFRRGWGWKASDGRIVGIFTSLPADHRQVVTEALSDAVMSAVELMLSKGIDGPFALLLPKGSPLNQQYAQAKSDIDKLTTAGVNQHVVGLPEACVLSADKEHYDLRHGGGWRVRSFGRQPSGEGYRFVVEEALAFRVKEARGAVQLAFT